jgi:hypothetical protein
MRANTSPSSIAPPCSKHQVARAMSQSVDLGAEPGDHLLAFRAPLGDHRQVGRCAGLQPVREAGAAAIDFSDGAAYPFDGFGRTDHQQQLLRREGCEARDRVLGNIDVDAQRKCKQGSGHTVVGARQRGKVDPAVGHFAQCGGGQLELCRFRFGLLQPGNRIFGG